MGERSITSPNLIRDTFEKVDLIQKHLLTDQSRQKSYVNRRRRPLEFEVGDHVFLKVMPKREVVRSGKEGKLSPSLSGVHEVFHVSMLHKYTLDPSHVVDWGEIPIDTDGTFEEGAVHILDSQDQVL